MFSKCWSLVGKGMHAVFTNYFNAGLRQVVSVLICLESCISNKGRGWKGGGVCACVRACVFDGMFNIVYLNPLRFCFDQS